jgi:hypothetical protein
MDDVLLNPRRAPRVPVRCDARVVTPGGGFWGSPTHDFGAAGCQLHAPERLPTGLTVRVVLENERVAKPVEVMGTVVWAAREPPWAVGLAFTPASVVAARPFFDAILAAYPGLDHFAYCPERVPADAPVAPGPFPRVAPELHAEEAELLLAVGAGARLDELRTRLGKRFERLVGPMFAMLGRHLLVVGPPDPSAAAAWREPAERTRR